MVPSSQGLIKPVHRRHKLLVRLAVLRLTQKDIALAADIAPSVLHEWISSDHRNLRNRTRERIAQLFGVPLKFLTDFESWDGLFNPPPDYLRKVIKEKVQNGYY